MITANPNKLLFRRELAFELVQFGYKQIMACLFGVIFMVLLILTKDHAMVTGMSRSDFLFLAALAVQAGLIAFRLEHGREVLVILGFHILATFMEWFKTSPEIGSWQYQTEDVLFRIYQVPLFAGFLYSAVGSYIARAWRLFEFRFDNYPGFFSTVALALLAYGNFFTHHYTFDIRWVLVGCSIWMFRKTVLHFKIRKTYRKIPLLFALIGLAFAIWIAENVGTYAQAWVYPNQSGGWELVHFGKITAWYLLMLLSFVLVSLLQRKTLSEKA